MEFINEYEGLIDRIATAYQALTEKDCTSWDIYVGEQTGAMAQERGISPEQWGRDSVLMQSGQVLMARELDRPLPPEPEWEQYVRDLIAREIRAKLNAQNSNIARKGLLIYALHAGFRAEGRSEAVIQTQLQSMDQQQLEQKLIDMSYQWAMQIVLPAIERAAQKQTEPMEIPLENAAAFAAAAYIESPAVQAFPEAVGCAAELGCRYQETSGSKILTWIAVGLLVLAAIIATLALLALATTALNAIAAPLLVDGAVTVGTAVTAEVALISESIGHMLQAALGSAGLGSAVGLLSVAAAAEENSSFITENTSSHFRHISV